MFNKCTIAMILILMWMFTVNVNSERDNSHCGSGFYMSSDKTCTKCNPVFREYMDLTYHQKDRCKVCPDGYVLDNNQCNACEPGTAYNARYNLCLPCSFGSYSNKRASKECKKCQNMNSLTQYMIGSTDCKTSMMYKNVRKMFV